MCLLPVQVCLGNAPLPGDAFVDQRLAVGDESFNLRLYVVANLLLLGLQSLKLSDYVALHSDRGQRDANEAEFLVTKPLPRRTCQEKIRLRRRLKKYL